MDLGKLSFWSRKIHRVSLWFVVVLGLIQMGTGLMLKYPTVLMVADAGAVLSLHVTTAGYFAVAFSVQMITGVLMYIIPWLLKLRNQRSVPPSP